MVLRDNTCWLLVLGAVLACGAGCNSNDSPAIGYVLGEPRFLAKIHRVVFIELESEQSYPSVAKDMTLALAQAIQARRLFHIDVIYRDDPICEMLSLDGRSGFSMDQLRAMRKSLGCDAVLIGSMRDFRPHPYTQMGLYVRLLDVKNGRLVWGVDHVWNTTDVGTEKRIRKFFDKQMRSGYEPMDWQLAMISPKVFGKFVAYEAAGTLPEGPVYQGYPAAQSPRGWADFRKIP